MGCSVESLPMSSKRHRRGSAAHAQTVEKAPMRCISDGPHVSQPPVAAGLDLASRPNAVNPPSVPWRDRGGRHEWPMSADPGTRFLSCFAVFGCRSLAASGGEPAQCGDPLRGCAGCAEGQDMDAEGSLVNGRMPCRPSSVMAVLPVGQRTAKRGPISSVPASSTHVTADQGKWSVEL